MKIMSNNTFFKSTNLQKKIDSNISLSSENKNINNFKFPQYSLSFGQIAKPLFVTVPQEVLEKEKSISSFARSIGISTPELQENGIYKLYGQPATPDKNPLTSLHLNNICDNLLKMDVNGLWHGDLDPSLVLNGKNGMVEFQHFRHGFMFDFKDGRFEGGYLFAKCPEDAMPSNLLEYESNCLAKYLSEIKDPGEQNQFLKNYLTISSNYYQKRFEYLTDNNFAAPENSMARYEKFQAKLFKNPSEEIIELKKARLNYSLKQREAFTEWDEGCGNGLDHKINPQRRINSIFMYLDCIGLNINYQQMLENILFNTQNKEIKEYIALEKKYFTDFTLRTLEKQLGGTGYEAGMARWNFMDKNNMGINPDAKDIKDIKTSFDALKKADDLSQKQVKLNEFRQLYAQKAERYGFKTIS